MSTPGSMPKPKHIPLPPSPEPQRPASHPFLAPSVSINEAVYDAPEDDYTHADIKSAIRGLRQAVETVQRGAAAIHGNEMKTEPARHAEAFDYGFKVTHPAIMTSDSTLTRVNAEITALKAKTSTPPVIRDALASEIRTAVRTMAPADRTKAVLGAARGAETRALCRQSCRGRPY
jgi:hypothetical protein